MPHLAEKRNLVVGVAAAAAVLGRAALGRFEAETIAAAHFHRHSQSSLLQVVVVVVVVVAAAAVDCILRHKSHLSHPPFAGSRCCCSRRNSPWSLASILHCATAPSSLSKKFSVNHASSRDLWLGSCRAFRGALGLPYSSSVNL